MGKRAEWDVDWNVLLVASSSGKSTSMYQACAVCRRPSPVPRQSSNRLTTRLKLTFHLTLPTTGRNRPNRLCPGKITTPAKAVRTVQFDTILNESSVIIIQMRVNTCLPKSVPRVIPHLETRTTDTSFIQNNKIISNPVVPVCAPSYAQDQHMHIPFTIEYIVNNPQRAVLHT